MSSLSENIRNLADEIRSLRVQRGMEEVDLDNPDVNEPDDDEDM